MLVTSINIKGKKNMQSLTNIALVTRWNKKSLDRCSSVFSNNADVPRTNPLETEAEILKPVMPRHAV